MRGTWFEHCFFRPAMQDISDLFTLGLSNDDLATLERELDDTWYGSEPWLRVPNHGACDVDIEIAADEIPGVAVRLSGTAPAIDELHTMIVARYCDPAQVTRACTRLISSHFAALTGAAYPVISR